MKTEEIIYNYIMSQGETCVNNIVKDLGIHWDRVQKAILNLRNEGLITVEESDAA